MAGVSAGPDDAALVPLDEVLRERGESPDDVRAAVAARRLPGPSAHADDGTPLFPRDLLRLAGEAGGVEHLRTAFEARYVLAADAAGAVAGPDQLDDVWWEYLEGRLGAVLRRVTPEDVVRRERLRESVSWLLDHADPDAWRWRDRLRARVDALEALERPGADELTAEARRRHPEAFAARAAPPAG